ncbi:MAG: hypothetical protein K2X60_13640 [Xanthobacteraceae bacterium]|nr:hypothetical protein [Xanthobacteraceae bacterium]
MAFLYSSEENFGDLGDADYRAYLISRNQAPIVHHSGDVHLWRLRVHARTAVNRVDGFLHWMIEALAAAKTRRLQRELALRGVVYRQPADEDDARSPRARFEKTGFNDGSAR